MSRSVSTPSRHSSLALLSPTEEDQKKDVKSSSAAAAAAAPAPNGAPPGAAAPKAALTREEERKLIELLDPFPALDPAFGVFILRTKKWESSASAAVLTDDKQLAKFKALWAEEQAKEAKEAAAAKKAAADDEADEVVALPIAAAGHPPGGADIKVEVVKKQKMGGSGSGGAAAASELDRKSSTSKKSVEPEEKDNLVLELAAVFSHVPHSIIKFALSKSKRDPERAVLLLSDDKKLDQLFTEHEKNKELIAFAAEAAIDYDELTGAAGNSSGSYAGGGGGGARRRGAYNLDSLAKVNFLVRVLNFIEHSIVTCGIFCLSKSFAFPPPPSLSAYLRMTDRALPRM